jgi:hypothetical protein
MKVADLDATTRCANSASLSIVRCFKDPAYRIELRNRGFGQVCLVFLHEIGGETSWLGYGFLFVFAPSICQL